MCSFRTRQGVAMLLLGLAAAAPAPAGQPQTAATSQQKAPPAVAPSALPAARDVTDRHIKAAGGRTAMLAHKSTYVTGTLTVAGTGITGTVEMFSAAPNKRLLRSTVPGVGDIEEGFDGTVGWTLNPITGPVLITGKELENRKVDSSFYGFDWEKDYESITTVEQTTFDDRPCYKLRFVRRGGGEDLHFYDVKTGLKAGAILTRENAMGTLTITEVDSDYKAFGEILHPTKLTHNVMHLQQVITITSVVYDGVDPSVFEVPAQIKALLK
jgi:hypothetical protein